MNERIIELKTELKRLLKPSRYEHTISVSYMCIALAMRYDYDLHKAELAGILHDCAKYYSDEEIISKCREKGLPLSEEEIKAPAVLHAKYGAWVAEHQYGIDDPEILSAIRYHTTGKPEMSLLDKIVFTADYIEPGRDRAPGLSMIRKLAFTDLDKCVYEILKSTLEYLENKGGNVDSATYKAYDYYKQLHNQAICRGKGGNTI